MENDFYVLIFNEKYLIVVN